MGFCGVVVFLAAQSCGLIPPVRLRLRATCLRLEVREALQEIDGNDDTDCFSVWLERWSGDADNESGDRFLPPAVAEAFSASDGPRLAEELAALAECSVAVSLKSRQQADVVDLCLVCGTEVVCASGTPVQAACDVGLRFPPVPWDVGAALCAWHGGCVGLSLHAGRGMWGLQSISPPQLGPVVVGDRYVACAETRPGDGLLVVPALPREAAPAGEATPLAVAGVPWIDCTGEGFPEVWDSFHALLLRERVSNIVYDSISDEVGDFAAVLLRDGLEHPFDGAELFKDVLSGTESPGALSGYCFGGTVVARVAVLRVLNARESGKELMNVDMLTDLAHVRTSLGHQLAQDFLQCCSRWSFVTGMDLSDIIDSERRMQSAGGLNLDEDTAGEAVATLAWAPAVPEGRWEPLRQQSLSVCVFGLFHFGTLQDAVTLLQVALSAVRELFVRVVHNKRAIKAAYDRTISGAGRVGDYLDELCGLLSCELEVPPWNELFRILDDRYERMAAPLLSVGLYDLAQRTARSLEGGGKTCDLVVSANMDLVYVSLLAKAFPEARLLYFATDSVLPHDTGPETLQLRLLAEELFFRKHSRGCLIVSCEKLQAQTFYQLGHWPRLAVAAMLGRQGSLRSVRLAGVDNAAVLVYGRAVLQVTPLRRVLEATLAANPHLRTHFVFATGALPFEAWSSFRACVFLPWHFHAVSLVEFVSLDMPLLVPVGAFAYALMKAFNFGFRQDSTVYYTNDAGLWRDGPAMPSPFWGVLPSQPARRQFLFWYELSHMRRRPGVCQFTTLASLLEILEDGPALESARREMRAAHLQEVARSAAVVALAVNAIFSSG